MFLSSVRLGAALLVSTAMVLFVSRAQAQRTFTEVDASAFPEVQLTAITVFQGKFWVVGGDPLRGTAVIASSADGQSWDVTERDDLFSLKEVFAADGKLFISGSPGGRAGWAIQVSSNGSDWTNAYSIVNARFAYGNGVFVAVGGSGNAGYSSDGMSWEKADSEVAWNFNGVVFGDGEFVSVGALDNQQHTTDGESWTKIEDLDALPGNYNNGKDITYGNGQYYGGGSNGNVDYVDGEFWYMPGQVLASPDATGQFIAQNTPSATWEGVAHANGVTVLVGFTGSRTFEPKIAISGTYDPSSEPDASVAMDASVSSDASVMDASTTSPDAAVGMDAAVTTDGATGGGGGDDDGGCRVSATGGREHGTWLLLLGLALVLRRRARSC